MGQIFPLSEKDLSTALAANDAGSSFAGLADPLGPQPVSVVFQAGWDGGDVTIVGTAVDPIRREVVAWSEVVTAVPGSTVETKRSFVTIVSADKAAVGASTDTAQLRALFPTKPPYGLKTEAGVVGNVAGTQQLHANLYVLKGAVTTGTVELSIIFWENDRWWVHPGGPLTVADTDINKSKVGRFVSVADPSMDLHVWLAGTGTLDAAWLYGKAGGITT
jgi:hypothetical protein